MKRNLLLLMLGAAALPLAAQQVDNQERTLTCDERGERSNNKRQQFCEMREYTLASVARIAVDAKPNGGISVKGWSGKNTLVRAQVKSWGPSLDQARALAGQVQVQTAGGNVYANTTEFDGGRGSEVSYEIFVPQRMDLSLKALNGGVTISDVSGDINFEAQNGGVILSRLGGNVRGETKNGGLQVELAGTRWEGKEMNVSTTNGGISLAVPETYSARLETSTVNGRVHVDFPVTVQGRLDREIALTLGAGGALVRATTMNGGVSVKRKS